MHARNKGATIPPNVTVSRVELDCSTYHHGKHWRDTVLPRLYQFARMVYKFRLDDLMRWRYLIASPVCVMCVVAGVLHECIQSSLKVFRYPCGTLTYQVYVATRCVFRSEERGDSHV